jgi:DNA (cytosine-5)-methyltransferase 1
MLGRHFGDVPCLRDCINIFNPPPAPKFTKPEKVVGRYSQERRFRAAIPNLRFKSGVRFELSNSFGGRNLEWSVKFFFGGSKNVTEIKLGPDLLEEIKLVKGARSCVARATNSIVEVGGIVNSLNPQKLQESWTHKHEESHPHDLVDAMGEAVSLFMKKDSSKIAPSVVSGVMAARGNPKGFLKVERNAHAVFAGFLIGSLVNEMLRESLQKVDV